MVSVKSICNHAGFQHTYKSHILCTKLAEISIKQNNSIKLNFVKLLNDRYVGRWYLAWFTAAPKSLFYKDLPLNLFFTAALQGFRSVK